MKKLLIMTLASLFGFCALNAQDQKVIDDINKNVKLESEFRWIDNQNWMEEMTHKIEALQQSDLKILLEATEKDITRMDNILATRDKIIGKQKKQDKIVKKLKKYFPEPEKALAYFNRAEDIKAKSQRLNSLAKISQNSGGQAKPQGKLESFSYHSGNGFAGWSSSVELKKEKDGTGTLRYEEKNFNRTPDLQERIEEVKVDDSVFEKVAQIVMDKEFYTIKKSYMPLYDVTDGTGWSMFLNFEKGYIGSGGYMAGPDKREVLTEILNYLRSVFVEIKEKK